MWRTMDKRMGEKLVPSVTVSHSPHAPHLPIAGNWAPVSSCEGGSAGAPERSRVGVPWAPGKSRRALAVVVHPPARVGVRLTSDHLAPKPRTILHAGCTAEVLLLTFIVFLP